MDDVELAEYGGGIRCQDHLLQVVDDDLVPAVRPEGGLGCRRDGTAGVDVPEDGSIFGVVASPCQLLLCGGGGTRRGILDLLVVAPLEQARVGRVGNTERHFGGFWALDLDTQFRLRVILLIVGLIFCRLLNFWGGMELR